MQSSMQKILLIGSTCVDVIIEIDVGDGGLKAEVVHTPKKA